MTWKLSATAARTVVEAALARQEKTVGWDEDIVLAAFEADPAEPETWQFDAYMAKKPTKTERAAVRALFAGESPAFSAEKLPESDWIAESQKGAEPIRAGRFHVHTPEHPASDETGVVNFSIPAAQAFGTGQHATTAGCLKMLDAMHRTGLHPRGIADIGTGTGLLAFAANRLWPHARIIASDIDPVCSEAVLDNAQRNGVPIGTRTGQLATVVADGMADAALSARAPYDLIIANILAGPLIAMADEFAQALAPRGNVVLAGLLTEQECSVRRAYRDAGLRLHRRLVQDEWTILWLRARYTG